MGNFGQGNSYMICIPDDVAKPCFTPTRQRLEEPVCKLEPTFNDSQDYLHIVDPLVPDGNIVQDVSDNYRDWFWQVIHVDNTMRPVTTTTVKRFRPQPINPMQPQQSNSQDPVSSEDAVYEWEVLIDEHNRWESQSADVNMAIHEAIQRGQHNIMYQSRGHSIVATLYPAFYRGTIRCLSGMQTDTLTGTTRPIQVIAYSRPGPNYTDSDSYTRRRLSHGV